MNRISVKGENVVIIEAGYNPYTIIEIRKIQGIRWVKEYHHWEMIPSVTNIPQLFNFAETCQGCFEQGVKELLQREMDKHKTNLLNSSKLLSDIVVPDIAQPLMPFQLAGVNYASKVKRCFIADQPGLGKTCQALATVQYLEAYPCVIVCPSILKENWRREVLKFFPSRTAVILDNKNYKTVAAEIYILNYDMLKKYLLSVRLRQPHAIIFDECHMLKEKKTIRAQSALAMADGVGVRLGLTGTPILSRPAELVSQLQILGQMEQFGNSWQFLQRYCCPKQEKIGWDKEAKKPKMRFNFSGVSNSEELNEILRKTCYIRRLKEEVLLELPSKRQSIIEFEIDNIVDYQKAADDIVEYLIQEGQKEEAFLSDIKNMSPIGRYNARHDKMWQTRHRVQAAQHLVKIEALKKLSIKGKMASINLWIDDFLATGEKLVVFAHHRNIVEQLSNRPGTVKILGSTARGERQAAIDSFQNDPNTRLIVCSLMAGGVGITLTAASNVVFCELGWTPAIHEQAEDRTHRIGQREAVNVWYLLGKDTIDEDIYSLLQDKKVVVDSVVEGKSVSILSGLIERLKQRRVDG